MGEPAKNLDAATDGPASVNGIKSEILKDKIRRIESLEAQKKGISEDISEVYKEAKQEGLDPKIMRKIVKLRATDKSTLEAEELLMSVYKRALGMETDG